MDAYKYPRTDLGNADWFVDLHKAHLRYDHSRKQWFIWNPPLWRGDHVRLIIHVAKLALRRRLKQAADIDDDAIRTAEISWIRKMESKNALKAMLELACADPRIAVKGDDWDADGYVLGCTNGVINLRTGKLTKANSAMLVTKSTHIAFDPNATCPRWMQFLEEIEGDEAVRAYISRAVGYSITGETKEQVLFSIFGPGGNGKSIFLETIIAMLGDYSYTMPFSTIEFNQRSQISNDVAALAGCRLVVASETQEGIRLNEGRIKSLTGNESVTARFLNKEYFTFKPQAKFWLAFNHKPRITDDSQGFWRRLKLLTFLNVFDGTKRDKELLNKLIAELPGILAWAVRECLLWQSEGLHDPESIVEKTKEYRAESNPLAEFIEDNYALDPDTWVERNEIYSDYVRYSRESGERFQLSRKAFGQRMRSMGFGETQKTEARVRVWVGLETSSFAKKRRGEQNFDENSVH